MYNGLLNTNFYFQVDVKERLNKTLISKDIGLQPYSNSYLKLFHFLYMAIQTIIFLIDTIT